MIAHLDTLLTQTDMEVLFDALHARTAHLLARERQALIGGEVAQADYYATLADQNINFIDRLKNDIKCVKAVQ